MELTSMLQLSESSVALPLDFAGKYRVIVVDGTSSRRSLLNAPHLPSP